MIAADRRVTNVHMSPCDSGSIVYSQQPLWLHQPSQRRRPCRQHPEWRRWVSASRSRPLTFSGLRSTCLDPRRTRCSAGQRACTTSVLHLTRRRQRRQLLNFLCWRLHSKELGGPATALCAWIIECLGVHSRPCNARHLASTLLHRPCGRTRNQIVEVAQDGGSLAGNDCCPCSSTAS
jgi:hypothetical protein